MSSRDALQIIKSCEKNISVLKWKTKSQIVSVSNFIETDPKKPSQKQLKMDAEVLFDLKTKYFKVHLRGGQIGILKDGSEIEYVRETSVAYNGTSYTAWKKDTPQIVNKSLYQGCSGEISNNLDESGILNHFLISEEFTMVGLRTGVPCLFQPFLIESDIKLFSEYLSEWENTKKIINIFRQEDGSIIIYAKIHSEPMSHYVTKVIYSPEKNGIITEYTTLLSYSREEGDGKIYAQFITECMQNNNGVWVPSRISLDLPFWGKNGIKNELLYDEFECLPKVLKNEFQVTFPDGTEVEDYIAKKFYKVGDSIDEDSAIDEFMQRHGLTGNVPAQIKRGNVLRYVVMGTGLLLIAIAAYQFVQKWRKV